MNIDFNKKTIKKVACFVVAGFVLAGGIYELFFNKKKDDRYPRLTPINNEDVFYTAPDSSYSLEKSDNGYVIVKYMLERIPEKYIDENGNESYIKSNDEVIIDGIAYREITVIKDPNVVRRK